MADDVVLPRMAVGLFRDQHHCTLFQGSRSGKVTLRGHRPTATRSASGSFHGLSPGPWRGTDLLLCDGDCLQDRHCLQRFVAGRAERPHYLICERGWNISERMGLARARPEEPRAELARDRGRTAAYRLQRILSLTLFHPPRRIYAQSGSAEVFEGFLGALVPADTLPDQAWTVDDVWLSGMAQLNGTKVWVNGLPRPVYANTRFDKVAALTDHVERGINRDKADRLAVEYLRRDFGVWP